MNKCECDGPGFCGRHRILKDETMYDLCRKDVNIFLAYEVQTGNIEEPGIIGKAINYTTAKIAHVAAGSPIASESEQKYRLEICASCPLLQEGICLKCGCPVEEKVKLATEKCPLEPPKWGKIGGGCRSCS